MRNSTRHFVFTLVTLGAFFLAGTAEAQMVAGPPVMGTEPEATVTLPLGSVVSQAGIDRIMNATSVAQFIESIHGDDLRVIGINARSRSRSEITIPARYQDQTGEMTDHFFYVDTVSTQAVGSTTPCMYIAEWKPDWDYDFNAILCRQDATLTSLRHEYLHHLINQQPANNRHYLPAYEREIETREILSLYTHLDQESHRIDGLIENEERDTDLIALSNEYFLMAIGVTALNAIRSNFEEMEIEAYLFFHRQELLMDRSDIVGLLLYIDYSEQTLLTVFDEQIEPLLSRTIGCLRALWDGENGCGESNLEYIEAVHSWTIDIISNAREEVDHLSHQITMELRQSGENYDAVTGDANYDGRRDREDLAFLRRAIQDPSFIMSYPQECICDVNGDGSITQADVVALERLLR